MQKTIDVMVHVSLLTMLICSVYMHVRDFWYNGNYSRHGEVAMGIRREMHFVEVEDIVLQFCLVYMIGIVIVVERTSTQEN